MLTSDDVLKHLKRTKNYYERALAHHVAEPFRDPHAFFVGNDLILRVAGTEALECHLTANLYRRMANESTIADAADAASSAAHAYVRALQGKGA